MSQRQTQSFLMRRFADAGLRPDARRGQNFLIDLNLLQLLVDTAALGPDDVVLEVGTGLGSLTQMLANQVAEVVTVEVDQRLFALAGEQLSQRSNVTMCHRDILKNKNRLDSRVLDLVEAKLESRRGSRFKLVANLPYNIATPLISNLLVRERPPELMVVTIQRELAERITADPGSKAYGALSVWVQSQCTAKMVRVLPPSVFWPRPKVHSAILQITPDPKRRAAIADRRFFHSFLRSLFQQRRKFLRGALLAACGRRASKADVDALLREGHFEPDCRAEQLQVERLLELAELVRRRFAP